MKEQTYKEKVETLIAYLKNQASFSINTLHSDEFDLLNDVKRYSRNYGNEDNKVYLDVLTKLANEFATRKDSIFSINISVEKHRAAYVELLERIVYTYQNVSKEEAIKIAYNSLETRTKFTDALQRFYTNFANAILYKGILDEVLVGVNETLDSKVTIKRGTFVDRGAMAYNNHDLYNRVYNSGLSLLDYAHKHFIDSFQQKDYFRPEAVGCNSKIAKVILERPNTCLDELINVINLLNEGELDIFGYYELTKLNPLFLKNIAKEHNLVTTNLSKFVSKNANPHSEESKVNKEMAGERIINSEVVSDELKIKAKQALVELDMPLTVSYYNQKLRQLIKSK